jgi:nucleotide-binding universal stress UspA family protein
MADRVLVPVDGSEQSDHACDLAVEEFPDATLVFLHVINPVEASYSTQVSIPSEAWYDEQRERAEEYLDDAVTRAHQHGVEIERAVEVGKPTWTIIQFAEDNDVDHIVMGSHGREGVTRILLGSVAETIVRRSPVPVTVVR